MLQSYKQCDANGHHGWGLTWFDEVANLHKTTLRMIDINGIDKFSWLGVDNERRIEDKMTVNDRETC